TRRGDEFFVTTDGPDGQLHEYKIAYTFGIHPLQQYLIEFPGGKFQALNVCWDTRPAEQGGQRWFHLYPNEEVNSRDPLHWTGFYQVWNYSCAECHSTNLQKNGNPETGGYATTWSEISVSCETCHGPGSKHVAWADNKAKGVASDDPGMGLVVRLPREWDAEWKYAPGATTKTRVTPLASRAELETCARCHARRAQVWGDYTPGRPLADTHLISLLDEHLYFPDGQIEDEVYEYGSFTQSKMYMSGVTCTNCHDPHSQKRRLEGNALCGQCHDPGAFDTPEHHHHPKDSPGAQCIECHMASRYYMVADARRDHSFRIPRPDLSVKFGVPNACAKCHDKKPDTWAASTAMKWWPKLAERPNYAEAIQAGRRWQPGAVEKLSALISTPTTPPIVRATALDLLRRYGPDAVAGVVMPALADPDPLVRRAAVEALDAVDDANRTRLAAALLSDPIRTVRMAAVLAVLPGRAALTGEQQKVFQRDLDEYRQSQLFNGERAESKMNLGVLAAQFGQFQEAESQYKAGIRLQPLFMGCYVNLADLYRSMGRDADCEKVLRNALVVAPSDGDVHHALGLALVRLGRHAEALDELAKAVRLNPDSPDFVLVYAVGLYESGEPDRALAMLADAQSRFPAHPGLASTIESLKNQAANQRR
ncbi:MAG TPA: tetratricopeptide repeat protein, partial [Blastocatellia bacterium]|nr:tetratricopeptide repeat protein [Blastocatellia bacterium]